MTTLNDPINEQAASAQLLRGSAEQNLLGATQVYVGNVLAPDCANRQVNMAGDPPTLE